MIRFEMLENRTHLSASTITASQLTTDKNTLLVDSAALKTDARTAFGNDKVDSALIKAAFAAIPTADQAVVKSFETAAIKNNTTISADISGLLTASTGLVSRSTTAGTTVLKKVTSANLSALQKDITRLDLLTTEPVSKLQSLLASTDLSTARDLIAAAFPQDANAINALYSQATAAVAGNSTIVNDAARYQSDLAAFTTDLTTVHYDLGTYPALVGEFTGTTTAVNGPAKGHAFSSTLIITTEDSTTGKLTGTLTDPSTGQPDTISGTVSLNGALTLSTLTSNGTKASLTGLVIDSTLAGKLKSGKITAVFSLTAVTP